MVYNIYVTRKDDYLGMVVGPLLTMTGKNRQCWVVF